METEALIVINYILEEKPMTTHDTLGKGCLLYTSDAADDIGQV